MKLTDAINQKKMISKELLRTTKNIASSFSLNEVTSFDEFHSLTNVNGVALVPKPAGDYMLRIYTQQEVKKEKLSAMMSKHYNVPADEIEVVTIGKITAHAPQTARLRPAEPGYSIGHYAITAGTFGCLVQKNGNLYILSNNHVLANENNCKIGDAIIQPGHYDGGVLPKDAIATLADFERLVPGQDNTIDAAIADIANSSLATNLIASIGKVGGVSAPTIGRAVKKSGRTTGLTHGSITAISVDIQVQYDGFVIQFVDQFEVRSGTTSPFSQGGDSGSLIVDEATNDAVGLLFAGNDQGVTFANPIDAVLNRFGVQIV